MLVSSAAVVKSKSDSSCLARDRLVTRLVSSVMGSLPLTKRLLRKRKGSLPSPTKSESVSLISSSTSAIKSFDSPKVRARLSSRSCGVIVKSIVVSGVSFRLRVCRLLNCSRPLASLISRALQSSVVSSSVKLIA